MTPSGVSFAGKRVFVTGHTGFKGSWLAIWLNRLGAKVSGYATPPPTSPSNFEVSRVRELLATHHEGDIRDGERLSKAISLADPEVIFHLAAQPIVRESYHSPRETFEVNVVGVASLLDAVRERAKPCVVIIITSDKCYENFEHVWGYRETDPLGGHDPYSASKGAAEIVLASYRRSFFPPDATARHGVKIASVRAGNVIGGGDWASDRLIPDIVRALSSGQPVALRNPSSIRPWQHVLDSLGGYMQLASRMLSDDDASLCSSWNFGPLPDEDAPVSRVTQCFVDAYGKGSWVDVRPSSEPHEANQLRLSIEKAISQLGWKPRWRLAEAVQRTARWYARYESSPTSMLPACLEDIDSYEQNSGIPKGASANPPSAR